MQIDGHDVAISKIGYPLEALFEKFYKDAFAQRSLPWDEIADAAREYFDRNPTSADAHDGFFNNFISLWMILRERDQLSLAQNLWDQALKPALAWEKAHPGQRLHKGTPYYFWAMTALLRGDIDSGYLVIHKAVQEDVDTHKQPAPITPGYRLVTLDDTDPRQAFYPWVATQAKYLHELLDTYNARYGRAFTIVELRTKFLTDLGLLDSVFLFTYTLARLMNIVKTVPDEVRTNAFAGQLELNLLFDLTLVIDEAIKKKDGKKYFHEHAAHLLQNVNHSLRPDQIHEQLNRLFQNDFDRTLREALDETLTLPQTQLDHVQCDVALAYGIRNHAAHNIDSSRTVWERFLEVQQALFRVFFATIDWLY